MPNPRIPRILIPVLLFSAGSLPAQTPRAHHHHGDHPKLLHRYSAHEPLRARFFHSSMHRQTRCKLPIHHYGHDDPRHTVRVIAQSLPVVDEVEVTWLTSSNLDREQVDTESDQWLVSRKRFHFPASNMTVGNVRLDQVGLSLYRTGQVEASGMIFHTGGPQGNLLGNRTTIRLQAYAGPAAKDVPFADATLLWSREHKFWARRDRYEAVDFAPEQTQRSLRRHFNEITHLAVELEYVNDR